jgi:uncharacterized membrane protein
MVNLVFPLVLLTNGLAAGGLMIAVLGGAPLLLSLPVDRYVPVHQFLVTRFDPFMPVNLVSALLLDAVLAALAPETTVSVLTGMACVFLVVTMTISLAKNVPINRWVATLDRDSLPDNWAEIDPRVKWRNWNAVRAAFGVAAFALNVTAAGFLL